MTLTPLEARVLGVLVEKEKTVPDTYPLSLNALTSGCNQKNNRDPLMNARETEVLEAVDALRSRSFVIESSGARVSRYSQNMGRVLRVPDQAVAILTSLMLRGPQTAAELRLTTERLHAFADVSSVEGFLDELTARAAANGGPLVTQLPRRPGEREQRWAHLLCGAPAAELLAAAPERPAAASAPQWADELAELRARVEALEREVAQLRSAAAG